MKIGILTFHRALNYGAVLQCYALQETLKSMGHDVEIIDYRPSYIEKYRMLFYGPEFHRRSFLSKIRYVILLLPRYFKKRKAAIAFDKFNSKYFSYSKRVKKTSDLPSYYECIVFGSDQIWSPEICEGFDPVFWGQFNKGNTKFVAYAASLGGHNHPSSEDWDKIKGYIEVFDSLSVREEKLVDDLDKYTHKKVKLVLDPTLLARKDIFDRLAIKPKEEKYVLLFTLEANDNAFVFAQRVAKERNCKLVRVEAIPELFKTESLIRHSAISPAEFCGYIKYADFIVTISFHGTAFSVIFNKNFYTIHSVQEDRAFNLLKSVGLEDRLVYPANVDEIKEINHSNTDSRIDIMRESSLCYIKESIG